MNPVYLKARNVARVVLDDLYPVTLEDIRREVAHAVEFSMRGNASAQVDRDKLIRELEAVYSVQVGVGSSLTDHQGHIPWLKPKKSQIRWKSWDRYRRFLSQSKGLPDTVVEAIDSTTDRILAELEDPSRPGRWWRRGMVSALVQAGKTGNYSALICKAADAGYRLIVVLAGSEKGLRSQTQQRIDEAFIGVNTRAPHDSTQTARTIGVGRIPSEFGEPQISYGTHSGEDGDFSLGLVGQFGISLSGEGTLILVVKKNAAILRNLISWCRNYGSPENGSEEGMIKRVPLLVIDDECDYASVDTSEDEESSSINGLIRRLLFLFEKSAYVGYTATPYANLFIPPDTQGTYFDSREGAVVPCGPDLFPKHFIFNLPTPTNHVGPNQVFGMDADETAGIDEVEPLPISVPIDDFESWMPTGHRKDHQPGKMPASMRESILMFILACAARDARGDTAEHCSMLLHVSRFTDVQELVAGQVERELGKVLRSIEMCDRAKPGNIIDELKGLWESKILPTTVRINDLRQGQDQECPVISWTKIDDDHLLPALRRIVVRTVNGVTGDSLSYRDHPEGLRVIAVGGDKLSRGLTLEGLATSYYLRTSRMYDTLMQMGRWFGYRPGYLDLCRVYTSRQLIDWFRHVTLADYELRNEFECMAREGKSPEQFGMRVRAHPDGLFVTSPKKLLNARRVRVSYSASISETVVFHKDRAKALKNKNVFDRFIFALGKPEKSAGHIWRDVSGASVCALLDDLETHPASSRASARPLADYVRAQLGRDELVNWTVRLASVNGKSKEKFELGGHKIGLTHRDYPENLNSDGSSDKVSIKRIVSPRDEQVDLTPDQIKTALEETRLDFQTDPGRFRRKVPPVSPSGSRLRRQRDPRNGLLLIYPLEPRDGKWTEWPIIGFAISFPASEKAAEVEYEVNSTYLREIYGGDDAEA